MCDFGFPMIQWCGCRSKSLFDFFAPASFQTSKRNCLKVEKIVFDNHSNTLELGSVYYVQLQQSNQYQMKVPPTTIVNDI